MPLTVLAKSFILDVRQSSECNSDPRYVLLYSAHTWLIRPYRVSWMTNFASINAIYYIKHLSNIDNYLNEANLSMRRYFYMANCINIVCIALPHFKTVIFFKNKVDLISNHSSVWVIRWLEWCSLQMAY